MRLLSHSTARRSERITKNITSSKNGGESGKTQDDVLVAEPLALSRRPSLYRVVLLNDDFTPMEFVVQILKTIFHKSPDDAERIMLEVHNRGAGICGIYTKDVAETKADEVIRSARAHEHPLQCIVEKV